MQRLILAATLLASSAATAQVGGEVQLSECSVFPAFDQHAIRYHNNGAGLYGVWFYDLVYRHVRTVLLLDRFGHTECEQPITRDELMTMHFEINEQDGQAQDVANDVRAWLAGHAIERCQ
jgi:hypothetical protein